MTNTPELERRLAKLEEWAQTVPGILHRQAERLEELTGRVAALERLFPPPPFPPVEWRRGSESGPMDGVWRCEACGEQYSIEDSGSWRWVGDRYQHSHPNAQTSFDARWFGPGVVSGAPLGGKGDASNAPRVLSKAELRVTDCPFPPEPGYETPVPAAPLAAGPDPRCGCVEYEHWCNGTRPDLGFRCSRAKGHSGPHRACWQDGGLHNLAEWPNASDAARASEPELPGGVDLGEVVEAYTPKPAAAPASEPGPTLREAAEHAAWLLEQATRDGLMSSRELNAGAARLSLALARPEPAPAVEPEVVAALRAAERLCGPIEGLRWATMRNELDAALAAPAVRAILEAKRDA